MRVLMHGRLWAGLVVLSALLVPAGAAHAEYGCTIIGSDGADILIGTSGDDVMCGEGGNDILRGGGGDDVIYGGTGNDIIYGGPGNDELRGNEDADLVFGEIGDDILGGGKGPDELWGGDGDDFIEGKRGDDLIIGGAGIDAADGGPGNDVCQAEALSTCEGTGTDVTIPVVAIEGPIDGDIAAGILGVSVLATDASGIRRVELWVDGRIEAIASEPSGAGPDQFSFAIDASEMENGAVGVAAVAIDDAGNWSVSELVLVIVRNELAPETTTTALAVTAPVPLEDVLAATDDAGVRVVELIHERQGSLDAQPSQALLGDLEGLPVVEPRGEIITGHFSARGLSSEQIRASYRSMYQERVPGGEPQIVAFRVDQLIEPSDLGALAADIASSAQIDLFTPLTPAGAAPQAASGIAAMETSSLLPDLRFWPTHGELDVSETTRLETEVVVGAFGLVASKEVEVKKALIESFLVWSPEARQDLVPGRAYEHDIKNYSPGRSGTRPLCNPLDAGDFYLIGPGKMIEHNLPAATNPYIDPASIEDECSTADLSFGMLNPEFLGADLPPEVWTMNKVVYEVDRLDGPGRTFSLIAESHTKQFDVPGVGTIYCENYAISVQPFCVGIDKDEKVTANIVLPDSGLTLPTCLVWDWDPAGAGGPDSIRPCSAAPAPNLLVNGSFETGDLTSWTPGGDYETAEVQVGSDYGREPAYDGMYSAFLQSGNQTTAWIEQTVEVVPGHMYAGSVFVDEVQSGTFGLQIIDAYGQVLAEAPAQYSYPDPWGPADLHFQATSDTVGFRLLMIEYDTEDSSANFDEARLVAAPEVNVNLDFETGDLTGWRIVGGSGAPVTVTTNPHWSGDYAASVDASGDLPVGLENQHWKPVLCNHYRASFSGGSSATVRVEVEHLDGQIQISDRTLTTPDFWVSLGSDLSLPPTAVTVRLLVIGGDPTDVAFDYDPWMCNT